MIKKTLGVVQGKEVHTLGDMIKSYRNYAGMTQKEFGHIVGVSKNSVSAWENNEYLPDTLSFFALYEMHIFDIRDLCYINLVEV